MATATIPSIEESKIWRALDNSRPDGKRVCELLEKARALEGLSLEEVATLVGVRDPEIRAEIQCAARDVKDTIYGSRVVLFAPLYVSNHCGNECSYCSFRARNREIPRRALRQFEIESETRTLIEQGHKRILLVAGEGYPPEGFEYILKAIQTIYETRSGKGEIRRVNVNVAPLTVDEFKNLKAAGIGTYQLFQETYHRETYAGVHLAGRKRDYDWRYEAMHRAMAAGIDDVGIGVLFGLYDWRFEVLALMQHIRALESEFGVGPHTISVPRLEPAAGSPFTMQPPSPVSDEDFLKIVAILRLAVPYTGIIMSTRESTEIRQRTLQLGVSQISAGSRTDPGGYSLALDTYGQFQLGDQRPLDEVVHDLISMGCIPSFCTACYRLGRTGQDFMDLAKPGEIRNHCDPNAVSTLQEYLIDYASPLTREGGEQLVGQCMQGMGPVTSFLVQAVRAGGRNVFI